MNDKLSDDDREIVSKVMMRDDKSALDLNRAMAAFICGSSAICFVNVIKENEYIEVYVHSLDYHDLQFRFHNKEEYNSFEKIFRLKYPDFKAAYTDNTQTFYVGFYYVELYLYRAPAVRIAARVCQGNIADDDSTWKRFCESKHDDYMLLLSKYLNDDVRFTESLNKRLEAASDSDKLLAMINMY